MLRCRVAALRKLASQWFPVALVSGLLSACGAAAPVDVGTDDLIPVGEPESEAEMAEPIAVSVPRIDSFVNRSWDRGVVSPYCGSTFQSCGGVLAGTWVVEDTCNPETYDREVLQTWGKARMNLHEGACWNAVQRLTSTWSGQLVFEQGLVIDDRQRAQTVDIELSGACLSATLGLDAETSVLPSVCESIENESTLCGSFGGVCMCSNRTTELGHVDGVYGVIPGQVAVGSGEVGNRTVVIYDYCVDGDALLWREPGWTRHLVLRRSDGTSADPDPVGIPR
jgi:hypothetical protein